jgi:hypothetical protein
MCAKTKTIFKKHFCFVLYKNDLLAKLSYASACDARLIQPAKIGVIHRRYFKIQFETYFFVQKFYLTCGIKKKNQ